MTSLNRSSFGVFERSPFGVRGSATHQYIVNVETDLVVVEDQFHLKVTVFRDNESTPATDLIGSGADIRITATSAFRPVFPSVTAFNCLDNIDYFINFNGVYVFRGGGLGDMIIENLVLLTDGNVGCEIDITIDNPTGTRTDYMWGSGFALLASLAVPSSPAVTTEHLMRFVDVVYSNATIAYGTSYNKEIANRVSYYYEYVPFYAVKDGDTVGTVNVYGKVLSSVSYTYNKIYSVLTDDYMREYKKWYSDGGTGLFSTILAIVDDTVLLTTYSLQASNSGTLAPSDIYDFIYVILSSIPGSGGSGNVDCQVNIDIQGTISVNITGTLLAYIGPSASDVVMSFSQSASGQTTAIESNDSNYIANGTKDSVDSAYYTDSGPLTGSVVDNPITVRPTPAGDVLPKNNILSFESVSSVWSDVPGA